MARRLKDAGEGIGRRVLELASHRDKSHKRETRMLGILQFVTTNVWKMLFGVRPAPPPPTDRARAREKRCRACPVSRAHTSTVLVQATADSLEKSVEHEDEFMIVERTPLVNTCIQ